MSRLCVECNERPIKVQKSGLCAKCYSRRYNQGGKKTGYGTTDCNGVRSEIYFAKLYFDHKNWLYQSVTFRLDFNETYRPDFYDVQNNVYIELSSSESAFSRSLYKVKKARLLFPYYKFEFRKINGELIDENKKIKWDNIAVSDMKM